MGSRGTLDPKWQDPVRFGVFEVDLASGELRKQGLKIRLQEQPFAVLTALPQHPGEVVTRDDLVASGPTEPSSTSTAASTPP